MSIRTVDPRDLGRELWNIDERIFSITKEIETLRKAGRRLAEINIDIDFLDKLMTRRAAILRELERITKGTGQRPSEFYRGD